MVYFDLVFLNKYGLLALLIITFVSYSVIPFPSEAAIAMAVIMFNPFYIMIVVLIGSTFGSMTSYYIGYKGIRKIFKKNSNIDKNAKKLFHKYGPVSILFFGWLPLIGDPMIILAGSVEMKFGKFLLYSTLGRLIYFTITIIFGLSLGAFLRS